MEILQMSVQAGLLAVAVIIIRALALYKLSRTTFPVLWGIVLLRMLVPFSFPTRWSIYNLFHSVSANVIPKLSIVKGEKTGIWVDSAYGQAGNMSGQGEVASGLPLVALWLCGMAALAVIFAILLMQSYRVLAYARPMEHPIVDKWLEEHITLRPLRILQSGRVASPLSMGILRPCIIFPEGMDMDREGLVRHVLLHEYIHVRRFDMLWKILALCAVCIHWFNPMAWAMLFLMGRDLELSCDEMVLRYFGQEDRAEYAGSLIDMAEQDRAFSLIHNYFGKNAMEERIISIMKYKNKSILSLISACIIVVGTGLAFATSAQAGSNDLSLEEQDRIASAAEDIMSVLTMMSYVDPQDVRIYYSIDGEEAVLSSDETVGELLSGAGNCFEIICEFPEDFSLRCSPFRDYN